MICKWLPERKTKSTPISVSVCVRLPFKCSRPALQRKLRAAVADSGEERGIFSPRRDESAAVSTSAMRGPQRVIEIATGRGASTDQPAALPQPLAVTCWSMEGMLQTRNLPSAVAPHVWGADGP